MLTHLETRLADVLGGRLAAPFGGRVFVTPGPAAQAQPALLVGVTQATMIPESFGSARRPELVPGADDPRRVVRLRCQVRIEVRPAVNADRSQTVAALDALLYELDSPDLRTGVALRAPGDPGFLLSAQLPDSVQVRADPVGDALPAVELNAEGWFWPPNTPGITGVPITAALVRTASLPVSLEPWPVLIRAGDPNLPLTVRLGATGTSRLSGGAAVAEAFGRIAARVQDAGGRPGAGALTGGAAGPAGYRLVTVADGAFKVGYTAPTVPATDILVIALVRGSGAGAEIAAELARFPLAVMS